MMQDLRDSLTDNGVKRSSNSTFGEGTINFLGEEADELHVQSGDESSFEYDSACTEEFLDTLWHVKSSNKKSMALRKEDKLRERVIKIEVCGNNYVFVICRKCTDVDSEDDDSHSTTRSRSSATGRIIINPQDIRSPSAESNASSVPSSKIYRDENFWKQKYRIDVRDIIILTKSDSVLKIQVPLQSNKPVSRTLYFDNRYLGKKKSYESDNIILYLTYSKHISKCSKILQSKT